ncbi:hypothetical protein LIZ31_19460, partial [Eggerthella lenta]|nr:hypothetical protein [Eggerthella lenta]
VGEHPGFGFILFHQQHTILCVPLFFLNNPRDAFLKKPTPTAISRQSVIYPKIWGNQMASPSAFHKSGNFR